MNNHMYDSIRDRQQETCALKTAHDCLMAVPPDDSTERWLWHIDHIVRQEDGGSHEIENLRIICKPCDWEREDNRPRSKFPELDTVYREYHFWMSERKAQVNKLKAMQGLKAGTTASPYLTDVTLHQLESFRDIAEKHEKYFTKELKHQLDRISHPIVEACRGVPYLGDKTIALLVSRTDIARASYGGSLCQYFGLGDPEERNPGLGKYRAAFRQWADGIVRSTGRETPSEYATIWRAHKERYEAADVAKAHFMAMRNMTKLMICHFWEIYRRLEGLEVPDTYARVYLSHDGYKDPLDYGWSLPT